LIGALAGQLLCAQAAMAAPAQRFDLICSGEERGGPNVAPVAKISRYRIDLMGAQWCVDACQAPMAIADITSDKIVLEQQRAGAPRGEVVWRVFNRSTGQLSSGFSSQRDLVSKSFKGTCQVAPFSGMPALKF
jgi:hypothetical protein